MLVTLAGKEDALSRLIRDPLRYEASVSFDNGLNWLELGLFLQSPDAVPPGGTLPGMICVMADPAEDRAEMVVSRGQDAWQLCWSAN